MEWNFLFFFNSAFLGVGMAMDAFSVSVANGLHEPIMRKRKMSYIAGTFAGFQFLMPMLGWICVHTFLRYFEQFQKFIPWIALGLLLYIGEKMVIEAVRNRKNEAECGPGLGVGALMVQGVATSIDALSVGFTIADYGLKMAFVCSLIIAVVTFVICIAGVIIGRKFGKRFSGKAEIVGGIILILIGIEIFVKGMFF